MDFWNEIGFRIFCQIYFVQGNYCSECWFREHGHCNTQSFLRLQYYNDTNLISSEYSYDLACGWHKLPL